jgi:late competence protein required for DNA uptake (superfamily II DNA/RNA helicase)
MESTVKFVKKPSNYIICAICRNVFTDPVINVKCGHTFCLRCIEGTGVRTDNELFIRCPEDGTECKASELVVNRYHSN